LNKFKKPLHLLGPDLSNLVNDDCRFTRHLLFRQKLVGGLCSPKSFIFQIHYLLALRRNRLYGPQPERNNQHAHIFEVRAFSHSITNQASTDIEAEYRAGKKIG
jgi:hypothetical protein